jgi:hypothetical protein
MDTDRQLCWLSRLGLTGLDLRRVQAGALITQKLSALEARSNDAAVPPAQNLSLPVAVESAPKGAIQEVSQRLIACSCLIVRYRVVINVASQTLRPHRSQL